MLGQLPDDLARVSGAPMEGDQFVDVGSAPARVLLRPARPEDLASRCDLFARIAMEAELVLAVDRAPDFDALYPLHSDEWISWVVEIDGVVEGMWAVAARDCWLGGRRTRVGYLSDLRFSARARGRQLLDRYYAPVLRHATARLGCELFMTAVISSNQTAMRALVPKTTRPGLEQRPRHTPLGDFAIRQIHLLLPRRRRRSGIRVRRAALADLAAIAALLDEDSRRRPFGYVFSEAELRRRIASWPGLSTESFLLAETDGGDVVGCVALWDAAPLKRVLVRAYRGRMRYVRLAYAIAARSLGRSPLPAPGGALRYQYLTHQAVPSSDPRILRALLDAACATARSAGFHFLSSCAPRGDRLEEAYGGFLTTDLAARVYLVTAPETPIPAAAFAQEFPGFEMALA